MNTPPSSSLCTIERTQCEQKWLRTKTLWWYGHWREAQKVRERHTCGKGLTNCQENIQMTSFKTVYCLLNGLAMKKP